MNRLAMQALLLASALLIALGTARYAAAMRSLVIGSSVRTLWNEPRVPAWPSPDSLIEVAETAAEGGAFRQAPVGIPEGSVSTPPLPPTPQISLVLRGIVGGPPWSAIVAGLPNTSETMLRVGDTVAGHWLAAIRGDTAVVRSGQQIFTLTIRRP